MFPSSGYFRGFNCPYYLSGLCERPYCHYRHVKLVHDEHHSALNSTNIVLTSANTVQPENVFINTNSNFVMALSTTSIAGSLNNSSEPIVTQSLRSRISLPPPKASSTTLSTVNDGVHMTITTAVTSTSQVKEEFFTSSNAKTNIIRDLPLPLFTLVSENSLPISSPSAASERKCSLKPSQQPTEYDPIGSSVSARRSTDPAAYVPTPLHILEEMERRNRTNNSRRQHFPSSDHSALDDYNLMELSSPPLYSPMPPPPTFFSKLSTTSKRSFEDDTTMDHVVAPTEDGKKVCFSEILSLSADNQSGELIKRMGLAVEERKVCVETSNILLLAHEESSCSVANSNLVVKEASERMKEKPHKKHKKRKSAKCEVVLQTANSSEEKLVIDVDVDVGVAKKHKKKKKKKRKRKTSTTESTLAVVEQDCAQSTRSVQLLYQDIFGDTVLPSPPGKSSDADQLKESSSDDEYDPMDQDTSAPTVSQSIPTPATVLPPESLQPVNNHYFPSSSLESKQRLTPREVCQLRHERLESGGSTIASQGKVRGSEFGMPPDPPTKESNLNEETSVTRPRLQLDMKSKVPMNIRQRYLEKMCDECERLYRRKQLAYNRAVGEEQTAYNRSANRTVYLNNVINVIKRLRKELLSGEAGVLDSTPLGQSSSDAASSTVSSKLYHLLQNYRLTEEQLIANGFPRWDSVLQKAVLPSSAMERLRGHVDAVTSCNIECTESGLPLRQVCGRCGNEFRLDALSNYVTKQECVYHWGRAFKTRIPGIGIQATYTCCQSELGARGCQLSPFHVHSSNRWADLNDYQVTRDLPTHSEGEEADYGVYALDCEMLYTKAGCELARVTVIDRHLAVVYERLVKPSQPVLDYNTRFSGLTAVNMAQASASLADVQRDLLRLIGAQTLLLGHSLESDLIALKLVHSSVVDTSVVFPHRRGPPLKRALRNLASDVLNKIIQSENDSEELTGHDSKEDACICMELMLHKVREDTSRNRRLV